jgi:hypothetical protein
LRMSFCLSSHHWQKASCASALSIVLIFRSESLPAYWKIHLFFKSSNVWEKISRMVILHPVVGFFLAVWVTL